MRDSAAKTYYVITLQGDRGPYSRADLAEALRNSEVQRTDQVRSAFGRPLGSVAQVLGSPTSDRALASHAGRPPPVRPTGRPWVVPLLVAMAIVIVVAALMMARGPGEVTAAPATPPPARTATTSPVAQKPPEVAAAVTPASPTVSSGDMLPGLAEAKGYRLVCDLDLRKLGREFSYRTDNRSRAGSFSRIAYLVELSTKGGPNRYIWTAMDAFTTDGGRIGLPTVASKAFFQTTIANLQVRTNMPGVTAGDFADGRIEFWPCNYKQSRPASLPTASDTSFDFGDTPQLGQDGKPGIGHGCMQVHNPALKQTLFAINRWNEGKKADIGIGNAPGKDPDWTFAGNADRYTAARLRVLILPR